MNINLGSLYNKIYNCAFKIVLFFLHLKLKIFKKLKVKFILFLIISMFIQDIIVPPINANTTDKIAYKGLRCDYTDENVYTLKSKKEWESKNKPTRLDETKSVDTKTAKQYIIQT